MIRSIIKSKTKDSCNPKLGDSISTLGFDSLDLLEVIMLSEEEFNIHIYDDEVNKETTLKKFIELIEEKL